MPAIWMDVDTALAEVPVNVVPLIDDTDFKTREESVAYNQAGMDLVWNFVTSAGAYTQTAVTPTTAGDYDWTNQGNGMYSIEIPASGGASINNDTEGYGWFTGFATGILPWTGPIIGFRAAALNNALCDGGDLLDVNVTHIADTSQTARDIGASVLLSSGTGTGQVSLSSGAVTVGTNNDKTGYSLTATTGLGNQTANITGNLSGSVGSVSGAVGSVTGNVGGNVVGSVASVTGGINTGAGTITTLDALDTAQDAQHSTTQSAVATVDGIVDNLNLGIIYGAAAGVPTTTSVPTDLTGYADDQLIGRVVIFTSGACEGEATDITGYANTNGVLTVTALTTAPSAADTFKIV